MMISAMPFVRTLRVVDFVAVDEEDQVGILLDGTGFAQIRHHRALVRSLLQTAVELRQGDYRTCSSLASALSEREISEISVARFSPVPDADMSWR